MREIKFRGKSIFDGEWWEGYYVYSNYDDKHYITQNSLINGNRNQFVSLSHFAEIDPKTLGEFTGLKDSTGKKIYEGDILLIDGVVFKDKQSKKAEMLWDKYCYGWRMEIDAEKKVKENHIEIIGNIHENPELLT
jgi:hypothetical protein